MGFFGRSPFFFGGASLEKKEKPWNFPVLQDGPFLINKQWVSGKDRENFPREEKKNPPLAGRFWKSQF